MYKNVETLAKACDGSVECEDGLDEWWLCTDNKIIIYVVFAISFAILIVWIILKCRKQRNKLSAGPIQQEPGKAKEDMAVLLTKRDEKDFWLKVNFQVLRNQFLEDEDERAETNKMLYDNEDSKQGFNVSKTKCSLKQNLELEACKIVLDDAFPGCTKKITKRIKPLKKLQKIGNKWMWITWTLKKIKEILVNYVDIFKDVYLLMIIFITIGGFRALILFPTKMTSVLVYCLCGSIVLPILISSLGLALQRIEDEKSEMEEHLSVRKRAKIIAKTLATSLMNPLGKKFEYYCFLSKIMYSKVLSISLSAEIRKVILHI